MRTHFVFPATALKASVMDAAFAEQAAALGDLGFSSSAYPDPMIHKGKTLQGVPPTSDPVSDDPTLRFAQGSASGI